MTNGHTHHSLFGKLTERKENNIRQPSNPLGRQGLAHWSKTDKNKCPFLKFPYFLLIRKKMWVSYLIISTLRKKRAKTGRL
jgi:hypothetical protein